MKKLFFIIIIICFFQINHAQSILQVRLNTGFYVENNSQVNDNTFNQILYNNNAFITGEIGYNHLFSHETYNHMCLIGCNTASANVLLNELQNYTTVVYSAYIQPNSNFYVADRLQIGLLNNSNGSYVNTVNNIVVTNNTNLNTVFQNYNVNKYENNYIRCNCNVVDLKASLESLNNVISNVNYVGYAILLSNNELNNEQSIVYPNPFSNSLNINSKNIINSYELYDLLGKQIINTSSTNQFDQVITTLLKGEYILNLRFENSEKEIVKLIKI